MGGLGYGAREPLVNKLKQLVDDIQTVYEEFLDAETLYQEDKISDKEFFKKMGVFVKVFSSLGFLSVKVIIEINNAIDNDDKSRKPKEGTTPSATYGPDMMSGISTPQYSSTYFPTKENISSKSCSKCDIQIPTKAKFCTKCGSKQ
ncbi:MAG: zinc ribbon domain-containing protein [Thaumarchaeota archaeon]|nr:zinc ribbon domain-containing protein [Nitrososphaerota archaeon]